MNYTKKIITKQLESLTVDYFNGSVQNLINTLNHLWTRYPGYKDFEINSEQDYDYVSITLNGIKEETDEEYKKRIDAIIKEDETRKQKEIERQQKLELKKKKRIEELNNLCKEFNVSNVEELKALKTRLENIKGI
jgi:hypothetical protein